MEWSDLGRSIASMAPLLGGALGGPGGAALGSLISNAFGGSADDPDGLVKLIQADPNAAIKLKELEFNNKVQLEKLVIESESNRLAHETSSIQAVNATMQQEAVSGDAWQRRWRPFWGYISGTAFFMQISAIIYVMIVMPAYAAALITALASLQVFWSVPLAVLGISAYQRGKEKRAALGESIQPFMGLFGKK